MPPESVLELQDITYTYPAGPAPALSRATLRLEEGELALVLGPSGGGKSTLLRCSNGLVPHFYGGHLSGSARVLGRDPVAAGPQAMSDVVGFVFQDPDAQFIVDDVAGELAFSMEARAFPREVMAKRIGEVTERLGVAHLLGRRLSTLSGGQRQRVAVAAALALRPQLLVLDEPTSQLDPRSSDELLNVLVELNRDRGLTVMLAEHRLERVLPYAHSVIFCGSAGEPPASGPVGEMLPTLPLVPPITELGRTLGWQPLPLTVAEARDHLPLPQPAQPPRLAPAPGAVRLEAQALSHTYPDAEALRDVSLTLHAGEIVALQGHNGAGKTTLLKALVGVLRPTGGRVLLDGHDVAGQNLHQVIATVGFVPQNPGSLLFEETVRREVEFTRRAHRLPPGDVLPLLEQLGLGRYAETYPRDLSQGERQRVALAAILAAEPKVLLLDEPTLGLDYVQKARLFAVLTQLRDAGAAILLATHDVELVAACAGRSLLLEGGTLIDQGAPGEVMLRHPIYASQISRLARSSTVLTVADALP